MKTSPHLLTLGHDRACKSKRIWWIRFSGSYGKIVTLARVAINRPIVNLGDSKTFSCNFRFTVVWPKRGHGFKIRNCYQRDLRDCGEPRSLQQAAARSQKAGFEITKISITIEVTHSGGMITTKVYEQNKSLINHNTLKKQHRIGFAGVGPS